jgi:ABC-type multidrug transport system ATPase subunit
VIACEGVSKIYRGRLGGREVRALDGLSLVVPAGEVLGIAGPNGAGKSTFISLLLGFLTPTSGTLLVGGMTPRAYGQAHGVGYLTELVALPPRWTVAAALRRLGTLAGLPDSAVGARVQELLTDLGLEEHRDKQVRQLSKGNLQRLGLAQALLSETDLVILDEPTHGLDPLWTQRFRDIVVRLRRPGRTILIASHNLDELERLTDRVAILSQGRLDRVVAASGVSVGQARWRLVLADPTDALATLVPGAMMVPDRPLEYVLVDDLDGANRSLAAAIAGGVRIAAFHPETSRLELEFQAAMGATT